MVKMQTLTRIIASILILLCAACTSPGSATPTQAFAHFTADDHIPFEFDYPAAWVLIQDYRILPSIMFFDPDRPTPVPDPGAFDSRGVFEIVQWDRLPEIPLDAYVVQQIEALTASGGAVVLSQENRTIDRTPAIFVKLSGSQPVLPGYITEIHYLYVGGYVYKIRFSSLEDERDKPFAQAVDRIIQSLKITP